MYMGQCSLAPILSPRLPVRVRLDPGQNSNLKFQGFPTGFNNDRKLCVSRVQSWGGPACELVWAVQYEYANVDRYAFIRIWYVFLDNI